LIRVARSRQSEETAERRRERVRSPAKRQADRPPLRRRATELLDEMRKERTVSRLGDVELAGLATTNAHDLTPGAELRPPRFRAEVTDSVELLEHAIGIVHGCESRRPG